MINSLHVENFTVFRKADFEFAPGINVLVGENATGKTHVLKLLYAVQKAKWENNVEPIEHLSGIFRPVDNWHSLVRQNEEDRGLVVTAMWNETGLRFTWKSKREKFGTGGSFMSFWPEVTRPFFFPPKDILANAMGFLSLYERRDIDYDETYHDLLIAAYLPLLREPEVVEYADVLNLLEDKVGGKLVVRGERFYLEGKGGKFEIHMVAEGYRKIALLHRLIANGSIGKDTVLYWDEPESNLNPSLMDEVIEVLYKLAAMGTQIFLATHSYIILKELELQKKSENSLRMFALERSKKDGSVSVHPAESYIELKPNKIADQYDRLYDLTIDRALGRADAD